jgi:hypothetical protein
MRALVLAGLACLAAPLAQLHAQESGDGEDIVVTGQAADPPARSEVSRQARAITRPGNVHDLPLARFEDRLCPGVLGLKTDYALMVVDRIREHAGRMDLWMAPDDGSCTPNFIVAFVREGQEQLNALQDSQGHLFRDLPVREREELLAEDGPVRVWTSTTTRTRDGMPIARRDDLVNPPVARMWMAHSKIYLATREDITRVVVVFDMDQVRGKTLVQLADYATMRGLARTREVEGEGQPMDTILALFDEGATPPAEMTGFDRAYLASVYDSIPNIPGITKILGVNRQLRLQAAADAEGGE